MTRGSFGVGVVGCGKIGVIRASVALKHPDCRIVIAADHNLNRAEKVSAETGCTATTAWKEVISSKDVDLVVVATTNEWLTPISVAALCHGKHVLCEKPMGVNFRSAEEIVSSVRSSGKKLKVGFNNRHSPAIKKARALVNEGCVGELRFVRCRYGHGGREGYEKEWRMVPERSGGGELLDQGVHVIDLLRWFLGDIVEVAGMTANLIWGSAVEDNAFALFRSSKGQLASFHVSWTQWKNIFSLELYGEDGAITVEGLGGSYGTERLIIHHRNKRGGAPREEVVEFPDSESSWDSEWAQFIDACHKEIAEA